MAIMGFTAAAVLGAGNPTSGRDFIVTQAISRHISAAGSGPIRTGLIVIISRVGSIARTAFIVFDDINLLASRENKIVRLFW